jgi:hypothetical protein
MGWVVWKVSGVPEIPLGFGYAASTEGRHLHPLALILDPQIVTKLSILSLPSLQFDIENPSESGRKGFMALVDRVF